MSATDAKPPETSPSNSVGCSAFEFDDHPDHTGRVELREDAATPTMSVVICMGDKEQVLISAQRDQWGVFVFTANNELCVAQEDGARSFTGALILALAALRAATECDTTAPTPITK